MGNLEIVPIFDPLTIDHALPVKPVGGVVEVIL